MFNKNIITVWFDDPIRKRGQGKRIGGGMVVGAMSARIIFKTRSEMTLCEFLKHIQSFKQLSIDINYMGIFIVLKKEDYEIFANDPCNYILKDVKSRMEI